MRVQINRAISSPKSRINLNQHRQNDRLTAGQVECSGTQSAKENSPVLGQPGQYRAIPQGEQATAWSDKRICAGKQNNVMLCQTVERKHDVLIE